MCREATTFRDQNGKVCTKCNQYREYSFYAIRKEAKDGHKSHCKCCINKTKEQIKEEKELKIKAIKERTEKACSDCHNLKSLTEFYKDSRRLDGHYCRCIGCEKKLRKEQREKHSEKRLESKRRYYSMRVKATVFANLELVEEFYNLARELTEKTGRLFVVDHILPIHTNDDIGVCGLHNEFNLQVIDTADNLRKGNKFSADDRFYEEFLTTINNQSSIHGKGI